MAHHLLGRSAHDRLTELVEHVRRLADAVERLTEKVGAHRREEDGSFTSARRL